MTSHKTKYLCDKDEIIQIQNFTVNSHKSIKYITSISIIYISYFVCSANQHYQQTYIAIHVRKRVKHVKPVHVDDGCIDCELRSVCVNLTSRKQLTTFE
jgi:hypothetical protein